MNDVLLADIVANFHFLRPEWFYALIPAVLLFALLRYRQSHHSNWEKAIDPHLLPHILDNPGKMVSKSPLSGRETTVLKLLGDGNKNKHIREHQIRNH